MPGKVKIPAGERVAISHGKLQVPDHPVIAFIEGDGVKCSEFGRAVVKSMEAL